MQHAALIHAVQHRDETDGIEVEDRLGESAISADRIVAGHSEDVMKPFVLMDPRDRFYEPRALVCWIHKNSLFLDDRNF